MASASSVKTLNPKAEVMGPAAALFMNINAANGLASVLKSNLGPNGTIKMLVGGAGDVKLTKDGNVLLRDMQIQSPTAVMIARAASAVDDATGDGTSTAVLMIGELMKQAERHLGDGCHPRHLVEVRRRERGASRREREARRVRARTGEREARERKREMRMASIDVGEKDRSQKTKRLTFFLFSLLLLFSTSPSTTTASPHPRAQGFEIAKKHALAFLDDFKRPLPGGTADPASTPDGRDALRLVARTALRTKLSESLADALAGVVLDAVLTIRREGEPIDLFMVEIMHMVRKRKKRGVLFFFSFWAPEEGGGRRRKGKKTLEEKVWKEKNSPLSLSFFFPSFSLPPSSNFPPTPQRTTEAQARPRHPPRQGPGARPRRKAPRHAEEARGREGGRI